jgi:hypothetical protein
VIRSAGVDTIPAHQPVRAEPLEAASPVQAGFFGGLTAEGVLSLQRAVGNGATARIVALRAGGSGLVQRSVKIGPKEYGKKDAAALADLVAAGFSGWQAAHLRERATALAGGDATHGFESVDELRIWIIKELALMSLGQAWIDPEREANQQLPVEIQRVNRIALDLRTRFGPLFSGAVKEVTACGFVFGVEKNKTAGFWMKPLRRGKKVIQRDVGSYRVLSLKEAQSMLRSLERDEDVDEDALASLMTIICGGCSVTLGQLRSPHAGNVRQEFGAGATARAIRAPFKMTLRRRGALGGARQGRRARPYAGIRAQPRTPHRGGQRGPAAQCSF